MENLKLNKNRSLFLAAIIITVAAQGIEKIIEVAVDVNQFTGLVCAMVYTICVAVVYYLISKGTSSMMGLLAALVAFRMMPPKLNYLANFSPDGTMLYFIVQKVALVLFAVLIYKFYNDQSEPREIKPLPILVIAAAVPFFNEIATFSTQYLLFKTGSMMLPYFTQYACYAAAVIITLAVAYVSGKESMRFAAYYEFIAISINIFRQLGKIGYFAVSHQHISKSFFGWVILFAVLMALAGFLLNKSKKAEE